MGCTIAIEFMGVLDQFLGISGALLGVTVILIVPTLCHYNLVAETPRQRKADLVVMGISVFILLLCSYNGIKAWINDPNLKE